MGNVGKTLISIIIVLATIASPAVGEAPWQTSVFSTNYTELAMICAQTAWDLFNAYYEAHRDELEPVKVGLVDTSVYTLHEDLRFAGTHRNPDGEILRQAYEIATVSGAATKPYYHGTHVAGILGAISTNDLGIKGMYPLACETIGTENGVPQYRSNMYASCFLGWQDDESAEDVSKVDMYRDAYDYLFDHDVKVINMSAGFSDHLSPEEDREMGAYFQSVLDRGQDFIIVKSAGNDGEDAGDSEDFSRISADEYPDVFHRIVFVGNTTTGYKLADGMEFSFDDGFEGHTESNYGARVDITAPGENIRSTFPDGGYETISGTSMAAPYVAGTAAMMWTVDPTATGKDIKAMLLATAPLSVAREIDAGWDPRKIISDWFVPWQAPEGSYRLLDARGAVQLAIDHARKRAFELTPEPTRVPLKTLPPLRPDKDAWPGSFEDFIRDVLVPKYGTIPQYTLYQSEDRSNNELGGMINAHCEDFDQDGELELLISRFHTVPGRDGRDELFLTEEMYERDANGIHLQDDMALLVLGITEVMGMYGSEAASFLYRHEGKTQIAFDTFFGINENSVTVAIYSYDGESFVYESDACHEAYGGGDILVRYAERKPGHRHTLSGVEWRILLEEADEPWKTLDRYSSEENDWALPSAEEKELLAEEYREMLAFDGLQVGEDCRILNDRLPENPTGFEMDDLYNLQFLRDLYYVYGETEGFEMLWQILSWQPLGGELMLERKDYGDLLSPYSPGAGERGTDGYGASERETGEPDIECEERLDDGDDSESALIELLSRAYRGSGERLSFGYADYDGDGRMEAFALMGIYDDEAFEKEAELWYVCASGARQCERAGGCYPFDCCVTSQNGQVCFHVSEGYFGSGGAERYWTASEEDPYLLSGDYMLEDLRIADH